MNTKTTNPLSRYFSEMEKKPAGKKELNRIFEEMAPASSNKAKPAETKKQLEVATNEPVAAN